MSGFDTCCILMIILVWALLVGQNHHTKEQAMLRAIANAPIPPPPTPFYMTVDEPHNFQEVDNPMPVTAEAIVFDNTYFDWVSESQFVSWSDD